eukprot:TRINITY_DN8320_c0_g1_i1.p1 TRINITY_DN8320_c0_g1~~TRINITY_DN8320_c0_g1_i1.p1  ORF type:complete len:114 (+),score=13.11 TRINITY_DN8320_c0_g1_i1:27-368(+)
MKVLVLLLVFILAVVYCSEEDYKVPVLKLSSIYNIDTDDDELNDSPSKFDVPSNVPSWKLGPLSAYDGQFTTDLFKIADDDNSYTGSEYSDNNSSIVITLNIFLLFSLLMISM